MKRRINLFSKKSSSRGSTLTNSNNRGKRIKIITTIFGVVLMILLIGVSYAVFNYNFEGEKNLISKEEIEFKLLESTSEIINIENTLPMSDEQGIKQEETFDFAVTTRTSEEKNIRYSLYLEKVYTKCSEIENPTQKSYPACYFTISEDDKMALIHLMGWTYEMFSDDYVAERYYNALIEQNDNEMKNVLLSDGYSEKTAEQYVSEDADNGYINSYIDGYQKETGNTINVTYDFNGNNIANPKYFYDSEVKIYLTDYDENALVGPTKITGLPSDYLLYTDTNKHNSLNKEQTDKFKIKVWVDNEVDASYWDENTKLEFKFKIGLKANTTKCNQISDVSNNDESNVNIPALSENMIPVYYDMCDNVWRKADETNESSEYGWYNYDEKMWANAVTVTEDNRTSYLEAEFGTAIAMDDINTMLVWIPRYTYTVWNYNLDGSVKSSPQEIQIEFEEGTSSGGEIYCVDKVQGTSNGTSSGTQATISETCKLKSTGEECTNDTCNGKKYTHPAFTFGDKELTGFWAGKFEVSSDIECTPSSSTVGKGCNLQTIRPLIKPNVTSWRGAMVGTFANNMMAMNDSGNIYGFATTDDTHVTKNMEWGAIAYLSHSKYGINKEIAKNSNIDFLTGCGPQGGGTAESGTICNAYNTSLGQSASTTGNVYGVYDMEGGATDYVMANMISPDGKTMMSGHRASYNLYSGYTGIVYWGSSYGDYASFTGSYTYPDDKYYDKYSFGTSNSTLSRSKLGDAIREIKIYGWYSNYSYVPYNGSSWLTRGGYYGISPNIFTSETKNGDPSSLYSSRLSVSQ